MENILVISRGNSPEYLAWRDMKRRGIPICQKWVDSYAEFLADVGKKPEPKRKYLLGRKDKEGNYEPGNVEWQVKSIEEAVRGKARPFFHRKGSMRIVSVRFTESDLAELRMRASNEKITVSEYVRRAAMVEKAMSADTKILLAEVMRNRELFLQLGENCPDGSGIRDVQVGVELIPGDVLVARAMTLRQRVNRGKSLE